MTTPRQAGLRAAVTFFVATAVASTASVVAAFQPPAAPAGAGAGPTWYGELDAGTRQFRFAIEALPGTGPMLRSFDEGDRRFPLDGFTDAGGKLAFAIKSTGAVFAAEMDATGTATGTWSQRGAELPLVFRRVAADETVPPEPDEVWAGTLDAVVQKLPLRFRITKGTDGRSTVFMDSLGQKAGGFRGEIAVEGHDWAIDVPAVKGAFRGSLGDDGTIDGTWRQGGASLKLTLEKVDPAAAAEGPPPKKRPQTPRPPFPYESREAAIRHEAAGVSLAGTLTVPPGAGPFPAVVLVSGSGPQDRDETLMDHKPFLVLADALSRAGIAVLRYDDRGVGGSTGDASAATSATFAADAAAAIEWLRTQPGIDPARIAVVGHSEGGLIAAMLAAERRDIAAIVMLAGTGVDGREILVSQGELVLRSEGLGDEKAIRRSRVMQESIIDAVRASEPTDEKAALARAAEARIVAALADEIAAAGDAERKALSEAVADGVRRLSTPWFRYFFAHDPAADLAKVDCPVLALVGEKDVQVDPKLNIPPIQAALRSNRDATVEEVAGVNHLFQTCTTGAVSEYDRIEETIAPGVLERVTGWLVKRLDAR